MDYKWHYDSPLGGITLASDGEALTGLWFEGQIFFADTMNEDAKEMKLPIFLETCHWLDIYFTGREPDFTPQLKMNTTPFRKAVWEVLLTIPFGKTMTYGEIAKLIAQKRSITQMSAQAIGGAVSHNPIALIIPCHRVVGSKGNLTGYAGGLDKKVKLLRLEGVL